MAAEDLDVAMPARGGSYSPRSPVFVKAPPARLVLHLGVLDLPYANETKTEKVPRAKKGQANKPIKPKTESGRQTTGDVAEILEDKYGIMDTFAFARLPDIAKALEESIAGELETLMMGGRPSGNPFASAESSIGTMFKQFISTQQIEHMGIEGVPTQAALKGVNHRLKHSYAKANPRRPSFIDTGMYVANFKCWVS
jgi:hypothetical protein